MKRLGLFSRFSRSASRLTGQPLSFSIAMAVVLLWAVTGPIFHFSDTWQLVINTTTTIVTFLMVFLIQNSQNRDTQAIQIKLDELIRSTKGAHNAILDLEELKEEDLEEFRSNYVQLAQEARAKIDGGKSDKGTPETKPAKKSRRRQSPGNADTSNN